MSLYTVLELAGAELIIKPAHNKLGIKYSREESELIKGDPRVVLKALQQCLAELELPVSKMTKYDLMAYGLKDASDEEVRAFREAEVDPQQLTTMQAVEAIEAGGNLAETLTDCVVIGNLIILTAIQKVLRRGDVKNGRLLLGQTASLRQVSERLKLAFDEGVRRAEAPEEEQQSTSGEDQIPTGPRPDWSEEVDEEEQGAAGGHREYAEAESDGSCEAWIVRNGKVDFNRLIKTERDFFKHEWLATKAFSAGAQKKFFSKVPRTVPIKVWAKKITQLLRQEGVEIEAEEVDTAGLWAFRKYIGQSSVIGAGANKRIVRK